jgi:GAF domain-containing protein
MLTDDGIDDLSRILLSEESLDDILLKVAHLAERTLDGSDAVSITLIRGGKAVTAASTAALAVDVDELQYGADQGPCLDAAREHVIRVVEDMTEEQRWPAYSPHAAERGVRSSMSVPLPVREQVLGAINVYSRSPRVFGEDDVAAAETLVSHAAVALANAELYAQTAELAKQLQTALDSRGVIEQAKGILMAQHRCTPDEAFSRLRTMSQEQNVKLRDVAARIVAEV